MILGKFKYYLIFILIPFVVGGISASLTRDQRYIYETLTLPPFAPPSYVFPIVWSILYFLMGVSSIMIFAQRFKNPKDIFSALFVYAISLFFNFLWPIIFFNMQAFFLASIWLLILCFLVLRTIIKYGRFSKEAANLQIPYFLWTLYAMYLNIGIFLLN